jgi:hypothetical protein
MPKPRSALYSSLIGHWMHWPKDFHRESGGQAPLPARLADAHTLMQYEFGLAIRRQAEDLNFPVLEPEPFETLLERSRKVLEIST